MKQERGLNAASRLKGLAITAAGARVELGEVTDLLTHPTEGIALGLVLRTGAGEERAVSWRDFEIGAGRVVLTEDSFFRAEKPQGPLSCGVRACGELYGTAVVTEEGKLLGRVREVYVHAETGRVFYSVVESKWRWFADSGGYIAGDLPHAYSRMGRRLIVPAGAELLHAPFSPDDLAGGRGGKMALAEERG